MWGPPVPTKIAVLPSCYRVGTSVPVHGWPDVSWLLPFTKPCVAPSSSDIKTTLVFKTWSRALQTLPYKVFTHYILESVGQSFRIEFQCSAPLQPAVANMGSAQLHPEIVEPYLDKELRLGHMKEPLTLLISVHMNCFGVIPKRQNTGNLSFPTHRQNRLHCVPSNTPQWTTWQRWL